MSQTPGELNHILRLLELRILEKAIRRHFQLYQPENIRSVVKEVMSSVKKDSSSPLFSSLQKTLRTSYNLTQNLKKWIDSGEIKEVFGGFKKFREKDYRQRIGKHTLDIIDTLEKIKNNDAEGINKKRKEQFDEAEDIGEDLINKYHNLYNRFFNHPQGQEFIFLMALVHDIGFFAGGPGHEERGAKILEAQLPRYYHNEEFIQKLLWVISRHVGIGTMFFGERTPGYLLKELDKLPSSLKDKEEELLAALSLLTFADAGIRVNNLKGDFYLKYTTREELEKLKRLFFYYRIKIFGKHYSGHKVDTSLEESIRRNYLELSLKEKKIFKRQLKDNIEVFDYGLNFIKDIILEENISAEERGEI
jgi:hypothetical protein